MARPALRPVPNMPVRGGGAEQLLLPCKKITLNHATETFVTSTSFLWLFFMAQKGAKWSHRGPSPRRRSLQYASAPCFARTGYPLRLLPRIRTSSLSLVVPPFLPHRRAVVSPLAALCARPTSLPHVRPPAAFASADARGCVCARALIRSYDAPQGARSAACSVPAWTGCPAATAPPSSRVDAARLLARRGAPQGLGRGAVVGGATGIQLRSTTRERARGVASQGTRGGVDGCGGHG